jgi:hypothetical protein
VLSSWWESTVSGLLTQSHSSSAISCYRKATRNVSKTLGHIGTIPACQKKRYVTQPRVLSWNAVWKKILYLIKTRFHGFSVDQMTWSEGM